MTETAGQKVREFGLSSPSFYKGNIRLNKQDVTGQLFRFFLNRWKEVEYKKSKDEPHLEYFCKSISCDDLFTKVRKANAQPEEVTGVIFHDLLTPDDPGFLDLLCEFNFETNCKRNRRVCESIHDIFATFEDKEIVWAEVPPATHYEAVVPAPLVEPSLLVLKQGVKVKIVNTERNDMNGRQGVISHRLKNSRYAVDIDDKRYSLLSEKIEVLDSAEELQAEQIGYSSRISDSAACVEQNSSHAPPIELPESPGVLPPSLLTQVLQGGGKTACTLCAVMYLAWVFSHSLSEYDRGWWPG